jgi:hypothetical protein
MKSVVSWDMAPNASWKSDLSEEHIAFIFRLEKSASVSG